MFKQYAHREIERLRDQWIATASMLELLELSDRAEHVLRSIDSSMVVPLSKIVNQIDPAAQLERQSTRASGESIQTDLRRLVQDLSEASDAAAIDAAFRVYTTDEAARLMNVSTKTITRWRKQGLVARKLNVDGRKRVVFYDTSLRHYMAENERAVNRAAKFRQLTDEERRKLIAESCRLAEEGLPFSEVLNQAASFMDVSVETVRGLLSKWESQPPEVRGVTVERQERRRCQMMLERFEDGESSAALARRFKVSKANVERSLWSERARRIIEREVEFIVGKEFELPAAEKRILADVPESPSTKKLAPAPPGLPAHLASLYEVPLLTPEQEFHLFRKYNYLKYLAELKRRRLDVGRVKKSLVREIEGLLEEAEHVRNWLVRANMRLVVAIAKKYARAPGELTSLMSDGNVTLMRAVEKFDFGRGFKFSTYATWALRNCFARAYTNEVKLRSRFASADEEILDMIVDERATRKELEVEQRQRSTGISKMLRHLSDREKLIVSARFGLDQQQEPMKLKEVGRQIGVSKERVRQLETRALAKLRRAAVIEHVSSDLLLP